MTLQYSATAIITIIPILHTRDLKLSVTSLRAHNWQRAELDSKGGKADTQAGSVCYLGSRNPHSTVPTENVSPTTDQLRINRSISEVGRSGWFTEKSQICTLERVVKEGFS